MPDAPQATPKRALILAGGGMRVAYQAGVVRALAESGLTFAHGDGTSGGTMNLAMMLSGLSPAEMCDRWRTLDVREFASMLPIANYLNPAQMIALGSAEGIIKKVFPHLGIDVEKIRRSNVFQGTFNVCNYTDKTAEVVTHQAINLDLLVAGISLPIYMPPVAHEGRLYLDAVWIKDANLMEAVRRGAQEIWVVWCIGNHGVYRHNAFQQYVHMIELSANGGLFGELAQIAEINERIRQGDHVGGRTQPIRLHLVKPEYPLPLDPDFFLGRIDAATLISMGYADARTYLKTMTPAGLPLEPKITKMKNPEIGFTFRETMSGGLTLGATDPAAGFQAGKKAGHVLAMHATITIQNLAGFLKDPAHSGHLNGTIDYPPFGTGIPAESGQFNLFCPTADPKLRLMVYELGFEHAGQAYYLAGAKRITGNSLFGLWKETTTLYTLLHRGPDKSGPVVGAGILSLGLFALLKMTLTFSALNSPSFWSTIGTVVQFSAFFVGQLWDIYILKKSSPTPGA